MEQLTVLGVLMMILWKKNDDKDRTIQQSKSVSHIFIYIYILLCKVLRLLKKC